MDVIYELAARLFVNQFESCDEAGCRREARRAIVAAEVFYQECEAHRRAAHTKAPGDRSPGASL